MTVDDVHGNSTNRIGRSIEKSRDDRQRSPNWTLMGIIVLGLGAILALWVFSTAPDGITTRGEQATETKSQTGAELPHTTKRP